MYRVTRIATGQWRGNCCQGRWLGCPWFLTAWAEGVEVESMIDTGCQVTILATSVFEKMCVTDPRVPMWSPACFG